MKFHKQDPDAGRMLHAKQCQALPIEALGNHSTEMSCAYTEKKTAKLPIRNIIPPIHKVACIPEIK